MSGSVEVTAVLFREYSGSWFRAVLQRGHRLRGYSSGFRRRLRLAPSFDGVRSELAGGAASLSGLAVAPGGRLEVEGILPVLRTGC